MKQILNEWRQYLAEAEGPMGQTGMHEPTTPEEALKTTAPEDAVDLYDIHTMSREDENWKRIEPLLKAFMEKKASNLPHREQCFDYGDMCVEIGPVYNTKTEPKGETDKNLWQLEGWGSEFVDEGIKDGSLECSENVGCSPKNLESAKVFFDLTDGAPLDDTHLVFGLWEKVAGQKPAAEPAAPAAEPAAEEDIGTTPARAELGLKGPGHGYSALPGDASAQEIDAYEKKLGVGWSRRLANRDKPLWKKLLRIGENRKLTKAGLKQLIREELSKELNK